MKSNYLFFAILGSLLYLPTSIGIISLVGAKRSAFVYFTNHTYPYKVYQRKGRAYFDLGTLSDYQTERYFAMLIIARLGLADLLKKVGAHTEAIQLFIENEDRTFSDNLLYRKDNHRLPRRINAMQWKKRATIGGGYCDVLRVRVAFNDEKIAVKEPMYIANDGRIQGVGEVIKVKNDTMPYRGKKAESIISITSEERSSNTSTEDKKSSSKAFKILLGIVLIGGVGIVSMVRKVKSKKRTLVCRNKKLLKTS